MMTIEAVVTFEEAVSDSAGFLREFYASRVHPLKPRSPYWNGAIPGAVVIPDAILTGTARRTAAGWADTFDKWPL
jgi:hypothetical protein